MGGGQTPLDTRTVLIGRRPTCDIPLSEAAASNTHALIFEVNGHRFIRDLGSRTGTLVNGKPIHHQLLEFGDEIRVGATVFRYASADAEIPEEARHADSGIDLGEEDLEPIGIAFKDEALPLEHELDTPIPLHGQPAHEEAPAVATSVSQFTSRGVVTASADDVADSIPLERHEVHEDPIPIAQDDVVAPAEEHTSAHQPATMASELTADEDDSADAFNLHIDTEPEPIQLDEPELASQPVASNNSEFESRESDDASASPVAQQESDAFQHPPEAEPIESAPSLAPVETRIEPPIEPSHF